MEELKTRLQANPMDFSAHLALIAGLRAMAPTSAVNHELRQARLAMHAVFPMDEEQWLAWLRDEAASEPVNLDALLRLHAEACEDYLSPALWLEYLQCRHRVDSHRGLGPEGTRALFKEAIRYCGAHYTRGELVWNAWVDFEEQTGGDLAYVKHRRAQAVIANAAQYGDAAAIAAAAERLPDETRVRQARGDVPECAGSAACAYNDELAAAWFAYLEHERQRSPKKQLGYLYERALADACLNETLWTRHLVALESLAAGTDSGGDATVTWLRTARRAVRNVSLSGFCWGALVRATEATGGDVERARNEAWAALGGAAAAQALFDYCAAMRRSGGDEAAAVARAVADLSQDAAEDEPAVQARQYQARLALERRDRAGFADAWAHVHKARPRATRLWAERAEQELAWGDAAGVRAVFTDALHRLQGDAMGFESVAAAWLQFERHRGSLADFARASSAVELKRPAARHRGSLVNMDEVPVARVKAAKQPPAAKAPAAKAPAAKAPAAETPAAKTKRPKKANDGADATAAGAGQKKRGRDDNDRMMDVVAAQRADDAEAPAGKKDAGKRVRRLDGAHTLFVNNLASSVDEARLRDLLGPAAVELGATVRDVRLMWKRANASVPETTGFAYVELAGESRETAAAALVGRFDQHELEGRRIGVAVSNPPKQRPAEPSHQARRRQGAKQVATAPTAAAPAAAAAAAPAEKKKNPFLPRALQVQPMHLG